MAKPVPHTDSRIDQAMNAVLERERQSRERIEKCEREATEIVDKAQRRARAVADRTDKRITALRQRCAEATQRGVDALLAKNNENSEQVPGNEDESPLIEAAVRQLARKLTGDAGDDAEGSARP